MMDKIKEDKIFMSLNELIRLTENGKIIWGEDVYIESNKDLGQRLCFETDNFYYQIEFFNFADVYRLNIINKKYSCVKLFISTVDEENLGQNKINDKDKFFDLIQKLYKTIIDTCYKIPKLNIADDILRDVIKN